MEKVKYWGFPHRYSLTGGIFLYLLEIMPMVLPQRSQGKTAETVLDALPVIQPTVSKHQSYFFNNQK